MDALALQSGSGFAFEKLIIVNGMIFK